ncbi:hypothetical protein GGI22_005290, partial [Coemansia erecta]
MFTPKHHSGNSQEITSPQSVGTPQTPRLNDDAAERRRRRKSAIERRRSNLVTPHRTSAKTPLFSPSPQLHSPAPFAVQLPRLTPEELNQRYEEWMKIAADNKINANNTWDFALIDYFYDMSLLRDGDSINFQKASCTLDGCVKIYSSRVDSVASETGRLLSGLAEAPGKRGSRRDDESEEAEDGAERQKSRRANRSAATLAKDFASISVKKLDLEFSVDPLFKKTSADFDEGGARGLLLNHLSFDSDGRIVFDASNSKALVDGDEVDGLAGYQDPEADEGGDPDANEDANIVSSTASRKHKSSLIDISTIDDIFGTIIEHLDSALICPSLADFEFIRDTSLDFSLLKENFRDEGADPMAVDGDIGNVLEDNGSFGDFGAVDDNAGDDGDDMGHFLNFDEADAGPVPLESVTDLQAIEAEEADQAGEGIFGSQVQHQQLAVAEDEDNLLSYFDMKLAKGWAGPEHWRLPISRAAMQKQMNQRSSEDDAAVNADESEAKRKRVEKQVYNTDFMNGPDVSADTLFARPQRASVIAMSKKAMQSQDHTLPEDVHFSSKNLFNLLLKPRLKFNPRRVGMASPYSSSSAGAGSAGASTNGALSADAANAGSYGGFVVEGDDAGNLFGDDGQLGDDGDQIRFDAGDDYDD